MKTLPRWACLTALVASSGFFANGCIISDCEDANGETIENCTQYETPTHYPGSQVDASETYVSGLDLVVESVNGNVDIEIRDDGGEEVLVTFMPYTYGRSGDEGEAAAKEELERDLFLETSADGQILVKTSRDGGSDGLGAEIVIKLPQSFDGDVIVDQNNGSVEASLGAATPLSVTIHNDGAGDIEVSGARGKLDLVGAFDIDVAVAEWAAEDGRIETTGGTGDITVTVPSSAHGSIQATASDDGEVTVDAGAEWIVDEAAVNSKTVTFGDGSGGVVLVKTDPTGLGSVVIAAD